MGLPNLKHHPVHVFLQPEQVSFSVLCILVYESFCSTVVNSTTCSRADFFSLVLCGYYQNSNDPYIVKSDTKLLTACISATFLLFVGCSLSSYDKSLLGLLQCFPFIYKHFHPDEAKTSPSVLLHLGHSPS